MKVNKFFMSPDDGIILIGTYSFEDGEITFPPYENDGEPIVLKFSLDKPATFHEHGVSYELQDDRNYDYDVFNDIRDLI